MIIFLSVVQGFASGLYRVCTIVAPEGAISFARAGPDGITIDEFQEHFRARWPVLRQQLLEGGVGGNPEQSGARFETKPGLFALDVPLRKKRRDYNLGMERP